MKIEKKNPQDGKIKNHITGLKAAVSIQLNFLLLLLLRAQHINLFLKNWF
jgi:hypothetical protein